MTQSVTIAQNMTACPACGRALFADEGTMCVCAPCAPQQSVWGKAAMICSVSAWVVLGLTAAAVWASFWIGLMIGLIAVPLTVGLACVSIICALLSIGRDVRDMLRGLVALLLTSPMVAFAIHVWMTS